MQQSLHLLGAPAANQHTVFVDDEEAAEKFEPAEFFDTHEELLERSYNRPRSAQLADPAAVSAGPDAAALAARAERWAWAWA
jgi:U3 small nucleolar RNA-associated protein 11